MSRNSRNSKVESIFDKQAFMVWLLIFLLFVIYFGGHLWSVMNRQSADQVRIVLGSVENFTEHSGIIIREEIVFTSGAAGVPVQLVNEGERVRVGDFVSSIQDAETVMRLSTQISALDKQAVNIQALRADLSIVDDEVRRLNNELKLIAAEYSFSLNSNNPQVMNNMRSRMEQIINERNELLLNESRGIMASTLSLRGIYSEQLNDAKYNIKTNVSGIVSFRIDGLEGTLTTSRLRNLTLETTRQRVPTILPSSGDVNEGEPVFKVITSNTWYIAAFINAEETAGWSEGMRRNIYILHNERYVRLETRIHILDTAGDYTYVVFSSNNYMVDFLDLRSVIFRTDNSAMEGFVIPNTAIAERTMLVVANNAINNSRVTVIEQNRRDVTVDVMVIPVNNDYSYVVLDHNVLRLGDILFDYVNRGIIEITEVRIMQGVYMIHAGATNFRAINLENAVSGEGFIILNRSLNGNIRVGDNIIYDVRNISDRQLIF